ncbi:SurA N-terminal domain-containing protein, partial [Streptococcus pneumoniae]|nr:SurA N-terminal domain-containing protein [Streptococcus pneumoniae]
PEMPEPDLEGIPEVVAEVNGEEVSKEEFETAYTGQFQQAAMQAQMSGQEIDQNQLKTQLAESMVGQKLLVQEAENQELTASDEEV